MIRIAMIGGGPKSLFALLELHERLQGVASPSVLVDVYDPYSPGAGRVWNTAQPQELRINVNARIIDASFSLGPRSFDQWRQDKPGIDSSDPFPPRALVGKYLSEQFEQLVQHSCIEVEHRAYVVDALNKVDEKWEVTTCEGTEVYDEVVLATGHGVTGQIVEQLDPMSIQATALTVQSLESEAQRIPAGSEVIIKGSALTAYDVVLRLTEGRSGHWHSDSDAGKPTLRYVPSGNEPKLITMTSRRGISMTPKPQAVGSRVQDALVPYRSELRKWGGSQERKTDQLWNILTDAALAVAKASAVEASKEALQETVHQGISEQFAGQNNPFEQLQYSLEVNHGVKPKTHEWVWGVVWSGLYREMVEALSRYEWDWQSRQEFNIMASNLERMAFGPPEPTALKLLALSEAGILRHEKSGQENMGGNVGSEVLKVDAVTVPPGVLYTPAPEGVPASALYKSLLVSGEIFIRQGERGILTDTDGTCLDAQGQRNESLTALGRPTEDPTLGHDTLNRTLHTEYQRWAQRVTTRVIASNQKVAR